MLLVHYVPYLIFCSFVYLETRPYNRSQITVHDVSFNSNNSQISVDVSGHTTIISSRTTYENSEVEISEGDRNQCSVTIPLPITTSTVDQMDCIYENSITQFRFKNAEKRNMRFGDALEEPGYLLMPIDGYQERPLMPLEKAIEPAKHLFGRNIDEMIHVAKERCQYPKDGLSSDESAAILLYTMEGGVPTDNLYYVLNNALRSEERRGLVPFFSYLKLILTALWKLPSEKCVAWRGVNGNITDNFKIGKTIVWWGFSSCTTSMNVLESSNYMNQSDVRTLFSIECMNGKIIRNHSYFKNENEILLLPAIQLQVLSKMSPAPNLHVIHLKEIEGPFPLLKPPFISVIPHVLSENNLYDRSTVDVLENEIPQGVVICARVHRSHSQSPRRTRQNTRATSPRPVQKLSQMLTLMRTNATVNLSNKQIVDDDLKILSEELKSNHRCVNLSLASNNITSDGIRSLTLALRGSANRTLKTLILSSNNITDEGARSISNMLKVNKTLETLDLSTNIISDNGTKYLAEAIKLNTTLKKLCLSHNLISDTGAQTLLQGLKRNGTLELMNLCGNQLSDDLKEKFMEQLSKRTHALKTTLL